MGWIHDKHMREGGSLGGMKGMKHKGPLRKVVEIYVRGSGMFDTSTGLLECGHKNYRITIGAVRARCRECAETDPKWKSKRK